MVSSNMKQSPILSIKQLVYNNLRDQIISGILRPGNRLPEAEIAERMSISRAPVREAFNLLEKDGFVEILPRRGAIVSEITIDKIFSIWEMRLVLEPYAAKISAPFITEEELQRAEQMMETVISRPEDMGKHLESELLFHSLLTNHLENELMREELLTLMSNSMRMRWFEKYGKGRGLLSESQNIETSNREHIEIIQVMRKHDPDQVSNVVRRHVRNSTIRFMQLCGHEMTVQQKMILQYFE